LPIVRRVALVIGNGAYAHTTLLPNPPSDGRAMAAKPRGLGYEVLEGIDRPASGIGDVAEIRRQVAMVSDPADRC